jgi:peptidoglycan hydrolase-like protein with peptidoglycan-binding domain
MSTFQTGQWVRRGRNIVILLDSPRPVVEEESGTNDTAWVQRSLNSVMRAGLIVDGIMGPNTRAAITAFQRSEGLAADGIAGPITQAALQRRLTGPYRPTPAPAPAPAPTPSPPSSTVGTFDGKAVASWLIPYLTWARQNGWRGRLNSGWRSPEHSERLCMEKCGAPTCPGTCAGRYSKHSASVKPNGAIDVSEYTHFGQLMARCPLRPRIFNDLPNDRVHFSVDGH